MKSVEIRDVADLEGLAEEVQRTQEPCVLQRDGVDIAVLTPVSEASDDRSKFTAEDDAAFLAAAGSWKDVDVDKFLEENYAQRRRSTRPRIEL